MLSSQIQLIERNTGKRFAAAPDGTVLLSSEEVGWRGICVELHSIPPLEMPEHYLEGHRLMVHIGNPAVFEWKDSDRWQQTLLKPGDFSLRSHGDINFPRWHDRLEFLAIAIDNNFVRQYFQDTKTPETIIFGRQVGRSDPVIAGFAKKFQTELAARTYCGALYGESLALAFSLYLLEQYRDRKLKIAEVVTQVAQEIGRSQPQVALAWLRAQSPLTIPIVGARKLSQIQDNLACVELTLSPEHLQRLNEVSQIELGFPHDFLQNDTIRDRLYGGTYSAIDIKGVEKK